MYRLNRLQDALQVLSQNVPDTPGKSLLEAQLQHRLGNYAAAIAAYNKLVQQHQVQQSLFVKPAPFKHEMSCLL